MNAARRHRLAAMLTGTVLAGTPANSAQPVANPAPLTEAEIQAGRQKNLETILTGEPVVARWARRSCVEGNEPVGIAQDRAAGRTWLPDASDRCLAAFHRSSRDGDGYLLYSDILDSLTGVRANYHQLPQQVADAIANGSNVVDVGQGKTLSVTSGLALDNGYTAAYADGPAANPPGTVIDPAKLKAATEKCVSQQGNNKICFTVGYVHGAAAWRADNPSASREPGTIATREAPSR